jgi:hypothetical protein
MTEFHQILNYVLGALVFPTIAMVWWAAVKITKLEVKTETMWGMIMKRAVVEGVHQGLMEVHSPVRLINDSGAMLGAMAPEIVAFYEKNCKDVPESKAALAIEREFGTRLATEVCIPNGISFGICLIIALAVAKGEPLSQILDSALPMNAESPIIRHEEQ